MLPPRAAKPPAPAGAAPSWPGPPRPRRSSRALLAATATALLVGCAPLERSSACTKLAELTAPLSDSQPARSSDAAPLLAASARFEAAAEAVGSLSTPRDLDAWRARHAELLSAFARELELAAAARSAGAASRYRAAGERLVGLRKSLSGSARDFRRLCQ